MKNIQPHYKHDSILAVSQYFEHAFSSTETPAISAFPKKGSYKNMVWILLDGMNVPFMEKHKDMFLFSGYSGDIFSVFPSATPNALASFYTGLSPADHCHSMYCQREPKTGSMCLTLQAKEVGTYTSIEEKGRSVEDFFHHETIFERAKHQSTLLAPSNIKAGMTKEYARGSDFTLYEAGNVEDCFQKSQEILQGKEGHLLHVYIDNYDVLAHSYGPISTETKDFMQNFDEHFKNFIQSLAGTDTAVIVHSDHGFLSTDGGILFDVYEDKTLYSYFSEPLVGEPRVGVVNIKEGKMTECQKYIQEKYSEILDVYTFEEIMEQGLLGEKITNEDTKSYFGDLFLVMKDAHMIKDSSYSTLPHLKGMHGGLREDEMTIPVFVFENK